MAQVVVLIAILAVEAAQEVMFRIFSYKEAYLPRFIFMLAAAAGTEQVVSFKLVMADMLRVVGVQAIVVVKQK